MALTHQEIGVQQELFMFSDVSPGSCFFLPHGTRIYNKLIEFLRKEYILRGYDEVITPNIANTKLWIPSGHWEKYKANMFCFECDGLDYSLTPMNCPKHILIYDSKPRSYKELPMRLCDFGVLHRNEASGALTGLTRLRKFSQDDGHIFCTYDQIEEEIKGVLNFIKYVYSIFNFNMSIGLSTRPENCIGALDIWDSSEATLKKILESLSLPYTIKEGDGAFYGPKIDIHIEDSLGRKHQCATVQLDFNLPAKFKLEYMTSTPGIMGPICLVHRAVLGSLERFFAILCEHNQGKWPLWLSPRQITIIPLNKFCVDRAKEVKMEFLKEGYYCDIDDSDNSLDKRIFDAQKSQYNYIVVIGKREITNNILSIRNRDSSILRNLSLPDFLIELNQLVKNKQ